MYTSLCLHCMELVIIADRRIWKASTAYSVRAAAPGGPRTDFDKKAGKRKEHFRRPRTVLIWAAADMTLYAVALLLAKFTNAQEYSIIIVLVTSPLKEFRHRISRTMHERGERSRGRRHAKSNAEGGAPAQAAAAPGTGAVGNAGGRDPSTSSI